MLEDSNLVLDIANYTIDVDGDDLVYSINGQSEIVDVLLDDSVLTIIGKPNMNGVSEFTLNVTDGGNFSNMVIRVNTQSVADLPTVAISSNNVN